MVNRLKSPQTAATAMAPQGKGPGIRRLTTAERLSDDFRLLFAEIQALGVAPCAVIRPSLGQGADDTWVEAVHWW